MNSINIYQQNTPFVTDLNSNNMKYEWDTP